MTLTEAIKSVLQQYDGVLTAQEIRRRIQAQHLYTKGNSTYPDYSQILMRIKNYPNQFEAIARLKE